MNNDELRTRIEMGLQSVVRILRSNPTLGAAWDASPQPSQAFAMRQWTQALMHALTAPNVDGKGEGSELAATVAPAPTEKPIVPPDPLAPLREHVGRMERDLRGLAGHCVSQHGALQKAEAQLAELRLERESLRVMLAEAEKAANTSRLESHASACERDEG